MDQTTARLIYAALCDAKCANDELARQERKAGLNLVAELYDVRKDRAQRAIDALWSVPGMCQLLSSRETAIESSKAEQAELNVRVGRKVL